MRLKEQLAAVKATLAAKRKEIEQHITKAATEKRTPNDDEESKISAIEVDIEKLEKNAKRLTSLIAAAEEAEATATPVEGQSPEQAEATADGKKSAPAIVRPNMEKGIGFAMLVKASAIAAKSSGGIGVDAILKSWDAPEHVLKAAVQKAIIGSSTNASFGAALVDYSNLSGEFIELVRAATIVDKLSPGMRQVPFNVKVPKQTSASTVNWVGEGATKPVTNPVYGDVTLTFAKTAGIVLLTDELVRFSNPKADALVREDLVKGVANFIDQQFFDPAKAEATASPASVLNGLTAITSTGTTAAAYEADLESLIAQVVASGVSLEGAYWVMGETRAARMSTLRDALGNRYFDGMSLTGDRSLMGLPVLSSETVANKIVLIIPSLIMIADDGMVDFSVSTEATINIGTDETPNWINLYQNNLTAIRAERYIRWLKRYVNAAGYIVYA
jgi:HK97 family phage major capsid protein